MDYKCIKHNELSLQGRKMPESWKESNKALIPKEGENVTLTRNYRSILLTYMNNDSKLFVTILADKTENNFARIYS